MLDAFISIIVWLSIAGNLYLGFLVIKKNSKSIINISLSTQAFIAALWATCLYFHAHPIGLTSETWLRIDYVIVCVLVVLMFQFSWVFPVSRKRKFWLPVAIAFITVLPFVYTIIFTKLFLVTVHLTPIGYIQQLGPVYPFFGLWAMFFCVATIVNYWYSYLHVTGPEKMQIQYLLVGFFFYSLIPNYLDVVLPVFFNNSQYVWISSFSAIFIVAAISYSILRQRLLDIDILFQRGAVYSLLLISTILIYVITSLTIQSILPIGSYTIASIIIAFTIIPLKNVFESATDKLFYKKRYAFTTAVTELTKILVQHPRLEELLNQIISLLVNLLKAERIAALICEHEGEYTCRASIGITDTKVSLHRNISPMIQAFEEQAKNINQKPFTVIEKNERTLQLLSLGNSRNGIDSDPIIHELNRLNMEIAVPLYNRKKLSGVILLSAKRSGDTYKTQDLQFLEVVSQETAASIENAISYEQLKEMDDIKSELISVVSHQLRTPLSVSRWNMELLLGNDFGTLPDAAHDAIDKTYSALTTLNQGLNNLMISLEIEEGHPLKAIDNVDMTQEINLVLKAYTRTREQKHITIQTKYEFNQSIMADVTKIRIILEILLDNALKYSPENGTVTISTRESINQGVSECLLTIEDNGIGIPVEHRDLVFNKFFRGEDAKHISPNGFGLGLFIARSFAQMHGGKLWIGEKETPGTLFFVSLPKTPNSHIGSLLPHQK